MTGKGSRIMDALDVMLQAVFVDGLAEREVFGGSFTAWCRERGIARATACRHRERIKASGQRWAPRSRRPCSSPNRTPIEVEVEVVRARLALGFDNGADSIRYRLDTVAIEQDWASRGWTVPSRATINKILDRSGLLVSNPRKRPKSSYRRFCYARPRDCYQIDATGTRLSGGGKAVVFEVLDDASRTLVATHAAAAETATDAITAITKAFQDFGVPAIVLSDNGSAFKGRGGGRSGSRFTSTVTDAGARLIHSTPYHPQTCGKVERHHRTFKQWLTTQPEPDSIDQLQTLCDTYQHWYNTQRRHSASNTTPRNAWDTAPLHGGPRHLPIQTDATVTTYTASVHGHIRLGRATRINLGKTHARLRVTVIRDGNHITVYNPDGHLLGHHHIDPTTTYQGTLRPAA